MQAKEESIVAAPVTREARPERRSQADQSARRALFFLSLAELLAMSLWFTGTAVLPQVTALWHAGLSLASWLTIAVQIGFAVGALSFALFNLPDIFSPITVFSISSLGAAAANAAFGLQAGHPVRAILLRGATGFFLAGVYPPGMKIIAGWFQKGRGLALGIMIGALAVASAVPHGINSIGSIPWKGVVYACSGLAALAALVMAVAVREGPYAVPQSRIDLSQVWEIVRNRRVRFANLGYLGHMWELYAMWGWIAVILAASGHWYKIKFEAGAALVIAIGAVGCIWAGKASDRLQDSTENARIAQRARVTIIAMAASGICCLAAALLFRHPMLLMAISALWGIAVIADSAQFSAIISECAEKRYMGTALTLQTALGYLLTAVSIRVTAGIAAVYGWPWALAGMSAGPALGIWAMKGLTRKEDLS